MWYSLNLVKVPTELDSPETSLNMVKSVRNQFGIAQCGCKKVNERGIVTCREIVFCIQEVMVLLKWKINTCLKFHIVQHNLMILTKEATL